MPLPLHVQAVCLVTNALCLASGLRDIFAPGTPLPLPSSDRMMLMWGSTKTKRDGLVAAPVEGTMLFIEQAWGALFITLALAKLTTVFTHTQEGTFLRRNLLAAFGVSGLLLGYVFYTHSAHVQEVYGANIVGYAGLIALEGAIYLSDALLRPRKVKKSK